MLTTVTKKNVEQWHISWSGCLDVKIFSTLLSYLEISNAFLLALTTFKWYDKYLDAIYMEPSDWDFKISMKDSERAKQFILTTVPDLLKEEH